MRETTMSGVDLIRGIATTMVEVDLTYGEVVDLTYSDDSSIESTDEDDSAAVSFFGDNLTVPSLNIASQANSGTSFIHGPRAIFFCIDPRLAADDPYNNQFEAYVLEHDIDTETVVSRMSTEEDLSSLQCLACATKSKAERKKCEECMRARYRSHVYSRGNMSG